MTWDFLFRDLGVPERLPYTGFNALGERTGLPADLLDWVLEPERGSVRVKSEGRLGKADGRWKRRIVSVNFDIRSAALL